MAGVTFGFSRTATASSSTSEAAFRVRKSVSTSREKLRICLQFRTLAMSSLKIIVRSLGTHYTDRFRRALLPRESSVNDQSPSLVDAFLIRLAGARVAILFAFHALVFAACY